MKSGDVLPIVSVKDAFDPWFRDPKFGTELFVAHGSLEFPNKPNIGWREFASWPSALFNGINGVVGGRSRKQVFGVYAFSIIAMMANVVAIRDWTLVHFKHKAMHGQFLSPFFNFSISLARVLPNPAWSQFWAMLRHWTAFINPRPKTCVPCVVELLHSGLIGFYADLATGHGLNCNIFHDAESNKLRRAI